MKISDTFKITGPQGGSPVICGTNEVREMKKHLKNKAIFEMRDRYNNVNK